MMPDGWTSTTLGADAVLVSGQHILAEECTDDPTAYPYITGPADFPNGQIHVSKYVRIAKVICEAGDILITAKGSGTGRLAWADRSYCISRQLSAIRPATWNSPFLFHVLSMEQDRLRSAASGLIPGLTRDDILGLRMLVPPLGEQRKIAAILSSVDGAMEATQAVIDQLQVVKKAMMAELLTRGLPGRHTRFKQTGVGEVPEEWEVGSLGALSDFVTSGSRGWAQFYSREGALFIRITNLEHGTTRLDLSDRQHVRLPNRSAEGIRTRVLPGDILISITADLGIIGLVPPGGFGEAYVNQHIALVRLDQTQADPRYIANVLAGEVGRTQVRRLNDGGAKAGLSLPSIRHLLVPLPPLDEQRALAAPIEELEDRLVIEREALGSFRDLKSALMSVLLTGEVRVTPYEAAA